MHHCPPRGTHPQLSRYCGQVPELGKKAPLVCIPTTSGTGSEVTPFAVVTDDATGMKYPLADYALTPTMAIVDTHLVFMHGWLRIQCVVR